MSVERPCIVRAYGNEPVKLLAFGANNSGTTRPRIAVIVGRAVDAPTIGFPLSDVYEWNEEQYATLRRAYESGDADALAVAWRGATRFDPAGDRAWYLPRTK